MGNDFSRRDFLRWASAGAGAAAAGGGVWLVGRNTGESSRVAAPRVTDGAPGTATETDSTDAAATTDAAPATDAAPGTDAALPVGDGGVKRLVVIEMGGGNDGFSMVVPAGIGRYYDLRQRTAVAADTVLGIDGTFGLHPRLTRLQERGGFAVVQGLGSATPDLSHFEMSDRWWAGDPDGTRAYPTGVFGRLADVIADPAASAVALSIGRSNHPALASASAPTMSIGGASGGGYLVGAEGNPPFEAFQRAFAAFSAAGGDGWSGRIRSTQNVARSFAEKLVVVEKDDAAMREEGTGAIQYPSTTLGEGLRTAAQVLTADPTVRVINVPMDENFDTHDNHLDPYAEIMGRFDEALDAFRRDLDRRGLGGSVVIMTTSEFGRRIADNASNGLDHGTASTGLIIGPVNQGLYGAFPDLDDRDDTDNLKATVTFDRYYATVFENWLGVPGSELFNGNPELLGGIF